MSTRGIAEKEKAVGYSKNVKVAKKGGQVAKRAKKDFELSTGKQVVSGKNFLTMAKTKKKLK